MKPLHFMLLKKCSCFTNLNFLLMENKSLCKCFAIVLFFISPFITLAQVAKTSELYLSIQKMDSLLFTEGFNNCNYAALENVLANDLEFYHDKGGTQNKKEFIEATKNNICNSKNGKITRRAVAESIEVFPLEKNNELYGVLQTGLHEFYIKETGKKTIKTGVAKFSCLWLLTPEKKWKLKRVFSYDHKAADVQ